MVSKIVGVIQKKYTSIAEAAFIISLFTFLSQILGVIRDHLFARFIGPGPMLDVYLAAFRIPDFLYVVLSALISATILIPLLSKHDTSESVETDRVNILFSFFIRCVFFICMVVFILMPFISHLIAPGFTSEQNHKLILLSRIMLLSPIMLGVSNFIGSINQYHKKFFAYASAPVLYNLGIILGIVFFYKHFGILGLGFGVILGGLFHLITQLVAYFSSDYSLKFVRVRDLTVIKDILRVSIPRSFTLSLTSLLMIIITSIASRYATGSISLVSFAFNIALVPLALIGMPFATASFPYFVNLYREKKESAFPLVEKTLEKITFWSTALIILFIIFRAHIVRVILGTSLFSWQDTTMTSALVFVILLSVLFQGINNLFVRIYYAQGNTKKPLLISFIGFAITCLLLLSIVFSPHNTLSVGMAQVLRLFTPDNTEIILVAFAYTIGAIITAFLFLFHYQKEHAHPIIPIFMKNMCISIGHACVLGVLSKLFLTLFEGFGAMKTVFGILLQAGLSGFLATILWFVYLVLINNEHAVFIGTRVKSFFSTHTVILEDTQNLK